MVGILYFICNVVEIILIITLCVCSYKKKEEIFKEKFWIIAISIIIILNSLLIPLNIGMGIAYMGNVFSIVIASIAIIIGVAITSDNK